MKGVVDQNSHPQPGPCLTRSVDSWSCPNAGCSCPLFWVRFSTSPTVIDLKHFAGWQAGVGTHNQSGGKPRPGATRSWPLPGENMGVDKPGSPGDQNMLTFFHIKLKGEILL